MLYIVPTPIGHLKDITFRAIEVLQEVDLILAEDTRVTQKLLSRYDIQKPMKSYHAHNEHRLIERIVEELKIGQKIALVSDAGTPAISDPGFLLIRACIQEQIDFDCLPGPTAFVTALVQSGFPSEKFHFEGFLPAKKGRQTRWKYLQSLPVTIVVYESPHKIEKCVGEIVKYLGPDRRICICRELTKMHQECIRGTAGDVQGGLKTRSKLKGEIVIVIDRQE